MAIKDSTKSTELVQNARYFLYTLSLKIHPRIHWTRSHVGTEGNEIADQLAKGVTKKKTKKDFDIVPKAFMKAT